MRPLPRPKTRMLWLYMGLLLVSIVLVFVLRRSSGSQAYTTAMTGQNLGGSGGDTLDVALVYGPMNCYIYGDTLGGYSYDLLRLVSRQTGVPMKFWPVNSLGEALGLLCRGRYDLLATLPVDASFNGRVLYSEPLFLDCHVLVQRKGTRGSGFASSVRDLVGDTVHIEKDSPVKSRLANLGRETGDTVYVREHAEMSSEQLALRVQSGQIRYAVVNERVAKPLAEKFVNLDISSPIRFTLYQCVVTAFGDSMLQRRLDAWLRQAASTPEARAICSRYSLP